MNSHHEHQVPRATAIVGLGAIALIHLLELQGKFQETPYLGVGYALLILGCLVAGALLLHRNDSRGWMIGGGAALGTLVGYAATRTVGLPAATGDIGNWLEPIGLASIFIEGIVVAIAGYSLATLRSTRTVRSEGRIEQRRPMVA